VAYGVIIYIKVNS